MRGPHAWENVGDASLRCWLDVFSSTASEYDNLIRSSPRRVHRGFHPFYGRRRRAAPSYVQTVCHMLSVGSERSLRG